MAIHINPAHRGALHADLGVPPDKKISISDLMAAKKRAKKTGDTSLMRRATFAENARSWNHA